MIKRQYRYNPCQLGLASNWASPAPGGNAWSWANVEKTFSKSCSALAFNTWSCSPRVAGRRLPVSRYTIGENGIGRIDEERHYGGYQLV
jgi:hypothetical protein